MTLVMLGLRNTDIAEKLNLSPGTIKSHLATIYRKTGSSNRADLVSKSTGRVLVKTSADIVEMLHTLRAKRATETFRVGTTSYHRQEGELFILDLLIASIVELHPSQPKVPQ